MHVAAFGFKSRQLRYLLLSSNAQNLMPMSLISRLFRGAYANRFDHDAEKDFVELLIAAQSRGRIEGASHRTFGIVFSMDRALQLHALLGSYTDLVEDAPKLKVIYRASSMEHDAAYQEVFREYSGLVEVKRQQTRQEFKALLTDSLSEGVSEHVFFLVDDNMFVEPTDLSSFASQTSTYCVPSLRMGQNLSRSYTLQRRQVVPHFCTIESSVDEPLLAWLWRCGELDWNYPLSLDGHMFNRPEILTLAKVLEFDSPNRLEEQLQKFHSAFSWRLGVCYAKSKLVNIPYNRVQTDINNLHGSVHQEDMLRMWYEGYRIDRKSYYGVVNVSAHQELPLRLVCDGKKDGD